MSLNPIEKHLANPNSMRHAINAKCYDCNYDPLDAGTWRQQVQSCEATDCPLHNHRPQSKTRAERGLE